MVRSVIGKQLVHLGLAVAPARREALCQEGAGGQHHRTPAGKRGEVSVAHEGKEDVGGWVAHRARGCHERRVAANRTVALPLPPTSDTSVPIGPYAAGVMR